MKKYTVRIFDGQNTWLYTTEATDIFRAENKIIAYHSAFGRDVVKVTTTEIR
jgi:hypothetical protein